MLDLRDAHYIRVGGYALLEITINGRVARIEPPRKPSLHEAGIVSIGSPFDQELRAQLTIDGVVTTVTGCSDDPRLFKMVDQLGTATNDGSFKVGPVEIPI